MTCVTMAGRPHQAAFPPTIAQNRFVKKDALVKLPRQLSADAALAFHKPSFGRRPPRRCVTEANVESFIPEPSSFRDDVQHAAAETYLITKLSFELLSYLGIGYRWMLKLLALAIYAFCLLPGFIQIGWYYFFSPCVHRSIVYGDKPRNRLDLYLPVTLDKPKPAVAFITGGAWIIGYKAWGALLAKRLADRDVIVACIDYRNFPQGTISDMVEDVSTGLAFFGNNIASFGGDPDRLFLTGQSAGAHIASCALIEQAQKESLDGRTSTSWSPSMFKMFIGISGGYNLVELVDHFHERGFYKSLFLSIMEGEASLPRYSPEIVLKNQQAGVQPWVHLLPPALLFHGAADYSIPYTATIGYANALRLAGVKVTTRLFSGKTHTDLFLQDPMRGGRDEVLEGIVEMIYGAQEGGDGATSLGRRLVPEVLLQLARVVSPF